MHNPGNGGGGEFEREDLAARPIIFSLIGLAVLCLVIYFLLRGMFRYLDDYSNAHQPPQNPLVKQVETDTRVVAPGEINKFPLPRLEKSERQEIRGFRLQEEQMLNSYGWVDEKARVARIPIERAMQLVAQRGLPITPKAGIAPPAEAEAAIMPGSGPPARR